MSCSLELARSVVCSSSIYLFIFARLLLLTSADILPSPLMASGTLVGSLSVHEKGHL